MEYYLTKGTGVRAVVPDKGQTPLSWLIGQSHRITQIFALKYSGSDQAKIAVTFKDQSCFHATFMSYRSMIAWLFHPGFEGTFMIVQGIDDESSQFVIHTASPEHWKLLARVMGK